MALLRTPTVQDHVALAEIELCGELMIAASAADEDRLSPDRIDEVLNVTAERALLEESERALLGASGERALFGSSPWE
ncbi:hypothetical protein [Streptomyces sp. MnatMP-M17]|uniref:hypothetical protein n=1 Tax=unclassified Streptomyces TaxID=2593676 RepID=UPI00081E5B60|nr:hypothetical protein [Streptomyces sp. MnatMP-M17]MYZ38707.1 hypothetical protein [Streptomyces sp. SID4917]SCF99956.1 hypothetical protein GA0115259_106807 [Streptomyces sp. MnatMP-M17]